MDLALLAADPVSLGVLVAHVAALVLAGVATALRRWSLGGFLAGVATLGSLGIGLLWFLALGGGRGNENADESVRLAFDPVGGGLWVTLYVVGTLAAAAALSWACRRGRARRAAAVEASSTVAPVGPSGPTRA